MKYADVILPLPVDSYTYRIPAGWEEQVVRGCRVVVPFGRKRYYAAVVREVHERPPGAAFETKEIISLPDAAPVFRHPQLRFWEWIASYYLCKLGDVYKAALSPGVKKGYTPRKQTFVRLTDACRTEDKLQEAFAGLKRAPAQEALLAAYLDFSLALSPALTKELSKKELLERSGGTPSALGGLLKRGILETYEKEAGRLQMPLCPLHPLTEAQQRAYSAIQEAFKVKAVCLLHGAPSSGKTELYACMIEETLQKGRQVLFLLPEIALTAQITGRMAKLFGGKLLVYHSKFSDNERAEVWNKLLHEDRPFLVLGVRSSLFLPFRNLGLVIVDEEHENTYKQQEPAPRYHARNAAIVLAGMHGAKTLLGSATPSIDSYYNALTGKYGLVELTTRYADATMPEIITIDVGELKRKKIMKDSLFSPALIDRIRTALDNGEQVILFQNRRGFAPVTECKRCGWTPRCVNCDISLTYHKQRRRLECHYCGYTAKAPERCPQCQSAEFRLAGFGTEKIEEETAALFPGAKVERMDLDSAHTRTAYERILDNFEKGKTQILVGTQMLSKGLDFGNVSVVGILRADDMMNFPDFRAHERAYQLMAQVSGRAGRRDKRGVVILQTAQPEHPLIRMVQRFAYLEMVNLQLTERKAFRYPPYFRLIILILRSRRDDVLQEMASVYAGKLRSRLGERVLGPVTPPVTRVHALYVKHILMKIEASAAAAPVRQIIEDVHAAMRQYPAFKQLLVHYDVDPL
ncbi:MAG: primosomal protein N' [Bacteroidales bacterium]